MVATANAIGDLESRTYRSRWQDGLLDLCGGIGVFLTGVAWQVEIFWLPGFLVPFLIVLWAVLRKRVVEPRIGRVTFGRERRERAAAGLKAAVWFGGGLFLLLVLLWVTRGRWPAMEDIGRTWVSGLPVMLLGLMSLMAAFMTGTARFAWYAAILAGAGVAGVLLGLEPAPPIMAGGGIVMLAGAARFFRFVSAHTAHAADGI